MVRKLSNDINLGKVFGIKLQVNLSWFVIFAIVSIFLATDVFPSSLSGKSDIAYWVMGSVSSLLFFASVLVHELAHSVTSIYRGIPVKSITLFIFGGAANITREADKANDDLLMAIAGPLSSCIVAGFFWFFYSITLSGANEVALVCLWLAQINLVLAIFNMLPGFPLDGGRIFRSIVWKFTDDYKRSTEIASHAGRVFGILLILGGVAFAATQSSFFSGIWMALIGWFLFDAASSSYKQVNLQAVLKKYSVTQIPFGKCIIVNSDMSLYEFANRYGLEPNTTCFLAKYPNGNFGLIDIHKVKSEGLGGFETKQMDLFTSIIGKDDYITANTDLLTAVQKMNENDANHLLVTDPDKPLGVLHIDEIIHFVQKESPESFKK